MTRVALTAEEHAYACAVGVIKHRNAMRAGRSDAHGLTTKGTAGVERNIQGCIAECVFAKWLDVEWRPETKAIVDVDAGANIDIKSGDRPGYGLLVQAAHLKREYVYVLVTPITNWRALDYRVAGWMWGTEVAGFRRNDLPDNHRPAPYLVPQDQLRDAESLKEFITDAYIPPSWCVYSNAIPKLERPTA